ncbi:NAD(P)H-flavin oxidoreductase [Neisseria meningitidis]|nr:NAD(P)H-flavin oxidoreductase [Neisseria meningitidis]
MFGNHGLCGLLEEGAHGKSPKCLGGNLGDFAKFSTSFRTDRPRFPPARE